MFTSLFGKDILSQCVKGFTQNQSKVLNATVWNQTPDFLINAKCK